MADLFAAARSANVARVAPLAARMRPRRLADYVGQAKIVGPGTLLRRIIESDRLGSVILYGPPGVGKTTLAEIIARETKRRFVELSATAAGVKEMREVLDAARRRLEDDGQRTCLFIDEIHRHSKAQQDVLLPDVESGVVALIGATTQNPFFALTSALVSRSRIFELQALSKADIGRILDHAVADHAGFPPAVIALVGLDLHHQAVAGRDPDGEDPDIDDLHGGHLLVAGAGRWMGQPFSAPAARPETRNSWAKR